MSVKEKNQDKIPSDALPEADIPSTIKSKAFWEKIALHQLIYSLTGLVIGFGCIVGGIVLLLNSIVGNVSMSAKLIGSSANVNDAAPGVILFIVGMMIIIATKYNIKIKK